MDLDFHRPAGPASTDGGPLFTATDVLEHVFCGRFTFFEHRLKLPEFQENRAKVVRGRELHAVREATNRAYLRKRLGVVRKEIDAYLLSPRHRLRGRVDEVLHLADGTAGPLDYKFAKAPPGGTVPRTLRLQSAVYALLIRATYGVPVRRGWVVYTRSGNRVVEIEYTSEDFAAVGTVVAEMTAVILSGRLPRRAPPGRCHDCCYRRICV